MTQNLQINRGKTAGPTEKTAQKKTSNLNGDGRMSFNQIKLLNSNKDSIHYGPNSDPAGRTDRMTDEARERILPNPQGAFC